MRTAVLDRAGAAGIWAALLGLSLGVAAAPADEYFRPGGQIAYALTDLHWATYQSADGKSECPDGLNQGPREQFKTLFPDDGQQRALVDTQLRREIDGWYPTAASEPFVFHEAGGPTALGMNLDGKIGPNDFTSPDGEQGIDNQLYRALGCIASYRSGGPNDFFDNEEIAKEGYNRILIVLTGVDSLTNSPHVDVTVYRGLDPLLMDASGKGFLPGGSERLDTRWGRRFIRHLQGKIVEGVLTTEPSDMTFPWSTFYVAADEFIHAARFRLKLSSTGAEGLIGGYADIETWYLQTMKSESTHHQSYGQLSPPSLYKAFRRLADAYPDPVTGANSAISSALRAKFVQVFVLDPQTPAQEASNANPPPPYGGPPFPRAPAEELVTATASGIASGGR